MRQEFLRHMHLRFLSGQEKDFDYSTVDGNVEYDSLTLRTQDEEEHYFDDEEPEMWSEEERTEVGQKGPSSGCVEYSTTDAEDAMDNAHVLGTSCESKSKETNVDLSIVPTDDVQS